MDHVHESIVETLRKVASLQRDDISKQDAFTAAFFLLANEHPQNLTGRIVNTVGIRALDYAEPAVWSLKNHHELLECGETGLNSRVLTAILSMRRACGGSSKVRPLHIIQVMSRMKYVMVPLAGSKQLHLL